MKKPLIIYLDSSDFSDLSNPDKRTLEIIELEKQLLNWQMQGYIELRFSHVHLLEAAATHHKYAEVASRRFSLIKNLCKSRCFISPIKILENEARILSATNDLESKIMIFNDEGDWFPDFVDNDETDDLETYVHEALNRIPNRVERRIKQRKYLDKNGKLKIESRKMLFESEDLCTYFAGKFPISSEALEASLKSYFKTGSFKVFLDSIKRSMSDLDKLGHMYEKYWGIISPISLYLREIGMDLHKSEASNIEVLRELIKGEKSLGGDKNQFLNFSKESLNNLIEAMPINFARQLAASLGFDTVKAPNWILTPSLFTMTTLAGHIFKTTILTGRNAKVSDFGDINHLTYLPYVDIFRADGFISSVINDVMLPFETVVVSKFLELPYAIEKSLNHRFEK